MIKVKSLNIINKETKEPTYWYFDINDRQLADKVLKDFFPNNTHEIVEVEMERFESTSEQDAWSFKHSW